MSKFVECPACALKPGSPPLCDSCLKNRRTIEDLEQKLSPRMWTDEMDKVWHETMPDLYNAFEKLRYL